MLKMTIDNEEVLSNNDISIKEEILSPSSTILNNVYPKSWELDKDYTSRFYYPKDYSKLNIQNFNIEPEEAGKTIQINGSATLTDVDTSKESRVLRLLGQTSQNGTPTPSSPIPVNVVSGDNEVVVCGKNLYSRYNGQYNVPIYATDGTSASYQDVNVVWIKVEPNVDYSFTLEPNQMQYYVRIIQCDKDKGFIARESQVNSSTTNKVTLTKTTRSNCEWLQIGINQNQTSQISQNNWEVMIEKSSTPTTYEPYIGNTYPIYLGMENLWKNQKKGWLPQSGSYPTTNSTYPNARYILVNLLKGQSLTISGSTSTMGRVRYIDKDTNQVVGMINNGETEYYKSTGTYVGQFNEGTITAKKDFIVGIMDMGGSVNDLIVNYGTTPQYITDNPIELCKIGTYQDYIYKDNGSWYLHKEIGKVVLNGSEGWGYDSTYKYFRSNTYDFGTQIPLNGTSGLVQYSDYFNLIIPWNSFRDGTTTNGFYWVQNSGYKLAFRNTNYTLTADFTDWLSQVKPSVYFPLATPTNTLIEDTTLIEQLEALSS